MSDDLKQSIDSLQQQVDKLNQQRILSLYNTMPKIFLLHFFKGIAFGLGSILGAGLILSLLVSALSEIEFIPIVGDWAVSIIEIVQDKNQSP